MKIKSFFFFCLAVFAVLSCKKDTGTVPVLTTANITSISMTGATAGGTIISDGGATVTQRGVCWSTGITPTIADNKTSDGTGAGSFVSTITGLTDSTTYYVRAYATNENGTGYGSAISFLTTDDGLIHDADGNTYHSVTIGTQIWMLENLKTTHYLNGDPITNGSDSTIDWTTITTGVYADYGMNLTNSNTYGRLYNWFAATDPRKICPAGWHVATHADWTTLVNNIGGPNFGGELKETGTTHWMAPNFQATNGSGFTALPGGFRNDNSTTSTNNYEFIRLLGTWWTATELDSNLAYSYQILNAGSSINFSTSPKFDGMSIRCVKD